MWRCLWPEPHATPSPGSPAPTAASLPSPSYKAPPPARPAPTRPVLNDKAKARADLSIFFQEQRQEPISQSWFKSKNKGPKVHRCHNVDTLNVENAPAPRPGVQRGERRKSKAEQEAKQIHLATAYHPVLASRIFVFASLAAVGSLILFRSRETLDCERPHFREIAICVSPAS